MQRRVMHSRHAFGHHAGPDLPDVVLIQPKGPASSNHTNTHRHTRSAGAVLPAAIIQLHTPSAGPSAPASSRQQPMLHASRVLTLLQCRQRRRLALMRCPDYRGTSLQCDRSRILFFRGRWCRRSYRRCSRRRSTAACIRSSSSKDHTPQQGRASSSTVHLCCSTSTQALWWLWC
jgi:hypothetical protein